jgi:MFS family permease
VISAFLLAQTAVTPIYGKLGDLYGRKRVLQSAVIGDADAGGRELFLSGGAEQALMADVAFIHVQFILSLT